VVANEGRADWLTGRSNVWKSYVRQAAVADFAAAVTSVVAGVAMRFGGHPSYGLRPQLGRVHRSGIDRVAGSGTSPCASGITASASGDVVTLTGTKSAWGSNTC
jgi:hypothetical protein